MILKMVPICDLQKPAKCEYQCDCKMAHFIVCGCNQISDIYKNCPYNTEYSTLNKAYLSYRGGTSFDREHVALVGLFLLEGR